MRAVQAAKATSPAASQTATTANAAVDALKLDLGLVDSTPPKKSPLVTIKEPDALSKEELLLMQIEELKKVNESLANQLSDAKLGKTSRGASFTKGSARSTGEDEDQFDSPQAETRSRAESNPRSLKKAGAAKRGGNLAYNKQSYMVGSSGADAETQEGTAKSPDQLDAIIQSLRQKTPFDTLDEPKLRRIAMAMSSQKVGAGDDVVKQGDQGDNCYVVDAGELSVQVSGKTVDSVGKGAVFGELAVMYDVPRTATITATSECSLWVLGRSTFQRLLRVESVSQRKEIYAFLKSAKIFATLTDRQLSRVTDVVESETFEPNTKIMTEGDDATAMYVIKEGQAVVSQSVPADSVREDEDGDGDGAGSNGADGEEQKLLGIMKEGEYFGERALLTSEPRSATVAAVSRVVCLRIDRDAFLQLLGPLHEQLERKQTSYKDDRANHRRGSTSGAQGGRRGSAPQEAIAAAAAAADAAVAAAAAASRKRTQPPFAQLEQSSFLGQGGFAKVTAVHDTASRRGYALKAINKARLLAKNAAVRTEALQREKQALDELDHPFIVTLHGVYQDEKRLYFLLELALGGELFRVMEHLDRLPEPMARFYIGSLTLAFQHMHGLDFVYRDLKPENVLLDSQGYIKLCDFGFAKKVEDRTYTQCGTPDYVAPEMLIGQGVNQAADWWALGVMLYEMLSGVPPFTSSSGDDVKTFANILKGQLRFPPDTPFSREAKAIIEALLQVKVTQRLGYGHRGAEDVIAHGWFRPLDFAALVNRTLEPPWHPRLKGAKDMSYFAGADEFGDSEDADDEAHEEEIAATELPKWRHAFEKFGGVGINGFVVDACAIGIANGLVVECASVSEP